MRLPTIKQAQNTNGTESRALMVRLMYWEQEKFASMKRYSRRRIVTVAFAAVAEWPDGKERKAL